MGTFIAVHLDDRYKLGNYPDSGFWSNYFIYDIPEDLLPRLSLSGIPLLKLPEDVAMCWKFAGAKTDSVKIRKGADSLALKQLGEDNPGLLEHNDRKYRYILTEQDIINTVAFMKAIIKQELHRAYDQKWEVERPRVSKLYLELAKTDSLLLQNDYIFYNLKSYKNSLEEMCDRIATLEKKIDSCNTIPECDAVFVEVALDINPTNYPIIEQE